MKYFDIFDKKYMASDFDMSHGKMSYFVSFPLIGFTLVIKLRKFDFEKKNDVRFEHALSNIV